ncbi:GMC oxidoreductase [Peniophora sp. CONT]|nr:GMC oxidoreductase [Peniophora sp. CONT]
MLPTGVEVAIWRYREVASHGPESSKAGACSNQHGQLWLLSATVLIALAHPGRVIFPFPIPHSQPLIMLVQIEQVANHTFDYVVVGGGLTGLVVATRLSEDPALSVLVLEAGEPNLSDPMILTPSRARGNLGNKNYDWEYRTIPQGGLNGSSIAWPRGKGLGGSSALNFMQFHLPARSDIDAFEKLGNKGWNWDLLRPYYKKAEKFIPPSSAKSDVATFDVSQHGEDGPIITSYPNDYSNLEIPCMQALESLGIPRLREPFAGDTKGTWITPISVDPTTGLRSYAANAYYEPNCERTNLAVLTGAHTARVELAGSQEGSPLVATSVAFLYNDSLFQVKVGKEVILAAGTIGTPQILEMSGIGDKDVISKAGVAMKHHLPGVGNNAQEHLQVTTSFELVDDPNDQFQTVDCLRDPVQRERHEKIFELSRTGPLALLSCCIAFAPLSSISPSYNELQDQLVDSLARATAEGKYSAATVKQHGIQLDHIKKHEPSCELVVIPGAPGVMPTHQPKEGRKYGTIICLINHPFSRGSIHISNAEPLNHPVIDPKYFEEPYDRQNMIEAIKFTRRLVRTGPLKHIFSGVELAPGSECDTDEKLADYIRQTVKTTYHTVGTCSMLPLEDNGVVDTNLKVYGTKNIRVVDISIIPLHIGAHLQSSAYAIAELAADIIQGKVTV